jgi:hypothetical protein
MFPDIPILCNSSNVVMVCPSSEQICRNDGICDCPPGTIRDRVIWLAPPGTCTVITSDLENVYITSGTFALAIAMLNLIISINARGTARATFLITTIWLILLALMNLSHYLEGYQFGPYTATVLLVFQEFSTIGICSELYHGESFL